MERWGETILGAIVAIVAIGFFAFAAAQAGQTGASTASYDIFARFQNVSGIAVGSDVRVSGVKVGVVRAVTLDPETYYARVTLAMNSDVHVLDASTARISSDGLLGGAYIAIEPAGESPLAAGGEITDTQSAVDLITVMSRAVQGMGNSNSTTTTSNP